MTSAEIRKKYLEFFKARGHAIIPSASLRPENDPTTLFTSSGMQPMVPYLLGKDHPEGSRIADSQKSFRAVDIDEVGDNRHTTFFEMLGNWSLGDYFKKEQLAWCFEFLTSEKEGVGLDPLRLYVSVFIGDEKNDLPRDTESEAIWKGLFAQKGIDAKSALVGSEAEGYVRGMKEGERIFFYDSRKNWWSRAGVPENMPAGEPGGPDSEVFYDFGTPHDEKWGKHCHPNCECGRLLEICNSVFMQYLKNADGTFKLLPKQNVDFGGGLERLVMAKTESPDIIAVNHQPILTFLESVSKKKYGANPEETRAFRIIADHMKAATFLISDGVNPSNTDQGYFVRRLIRRAVRYADAIGIEENSFAGVVRPVADMYVDQYPDVRKNTQRIADIVSEEESRFRKTLARGLKEFEKIVSKGRITGKDAFTLFSSYGFPLELIVEMAPAGISIDIIEFGDEMKKHQDLSRAGAEQKFKGGLADSHEKTVKLHTAHHLLLRALQIVLGTGVKQRGSNITQERLRIDFSYGSKMTKEELADVEKIVNEKIDEDLPVIRSEMTKEEAEKLGAEHEFGQQYGERVSVYSVGPHGATLENPQFDKRFSIEFCGGPHVSHTGALGEGGKKFKIQKEEAVAAGVRRIKATLE